MLVRAGEQTDEDESGSITKMQMRRMKNMRTRVMTKKTTKASMWFRSVQTFDRSALKRMTSIDRRRDELDRDKVGMNRSTGSTPVHEYIRQGMVSRRQGQLICQ